MSEDFYCEEALSGRTKVTVVAETEEVLAFEHTRPFWPVHIVVMPKRHVPSLVDFHVCSRQPLRPDTAQGRRRAVRIWSARGRRQRGEVCGAAGVAYGLDGNRGPYC
ncbi:HIT domain-containing protein [Micromonospora coriariae]|uniref:HIT domain-containing protein n=1 Tax=Micromonospora coriariae TaxID=285665 RepID=UPI0038CC0996